MKKQHNIPTPLGLAFLLGSLLVGVFFIGLKTSYEADLSAGEIPEEVRVTNVDDRSFTVSWVTKNLSQGSVSYGESPAFGKIEAGGDPSFVHHVRVENLAPSSKYFFEVVSGEESYGDFGAPYTVYTGPFLGMSPLSKAEVVYGTVGMPSGRPEPALVYLTLDGSQVFSTLTSPRGDWAMTLSSVRTGDLSSYFLLTGGAPLRISVRANARDVALAKISLEAARPVPEMRLGESYDFSDIALARSARPPAATLQVPQLLGASSEKVREQSESRESLFLLTPYMVGSIIGLGLFALGLLVGGNLFSRVKFFRKAKPLS